MKSANISSLSRKYRFFLENSRFTDSESKSHIIQFFIQFFENILKKIKITSSYLVGSSCSGLLVTVETSRPICRIVLGRPIVASLNFSLSSLSLSLSICLSLPLSFSLSLSLSL